MNQTVESALKYGIPVAASALGALIGRKHPITGTLVAAGGMFAGSQFTSAYEKDIAAVAAHGRQLRTATA